MNKIAALLGAHIRKLRKKRGLTIRELSDKADLSTDFISDIERGRKEPSVTTLSKISDALGVKIGYLLNPVEKKIYESATVEILSDEPTKEILAMLEGRSAYQIKTASRVLKGLFEEEEKEKKR